MVSQEDTGMQNYISGPDGRRCGQETQAQKFLKILLFCFFYQCIVFLLNRELGEDIYGFVRTLINDILKKKKKNFVLWIRVKQVQDEKATRQLTESKVHVIHNVS